jgi:flavin reductase (DIM6/NTAB) family NADH-FMN oxidoreductase RutF
MNKGIKLLTEISIKEFIMPPLKNWMGAGMLLTSGSFSRKHFNTMTVGWGLTGILWNKPIVQTYVDASRYTFQFTEQYDTFTICAFDSSYHDTLMYLGTHSGREGDKISQAGLTPIASHRIESPGFAEAKLVIECRKIYWDDFETENYLLPNFMGKTRFHENHRIYWGEILHIRGTERYRIKE